MKKKELRTSFGKRALSFVLTLCMLAALMPQPLEPLFALAGEGKNYIFDFRKAYPTVSTSIAYEMTDSGEENAGELNSSIYSDPWAASAQMISDRTSDYRQEYLSNAINMGLRINSTFDAGPVIKFKVDEDGLYMPRVTVASSWDSSNTIAGANLKFEIGTMNANGTIAKSLAMTDAVNAGGLNAPIPVYLSDEPISLSAGEYGLRIANTTKGSKDFYPGEIVYYAYIQSFELLSDGYQEKLPVNETNELTELVYDFTALNTADKLGSQAAASAITYQDAIDAGSAPWTVYSFKAGNYLADATPWAADREGFYYKYSGRGLTVGNNTENRVQYSGAVMIHVPTDGYYKVKMTAGNTNSAHKSAYYFMPLKANRSVGTDSTTGVQDRSNVVTVGAHGEYVFNAGAPMKLNAGEYIVFIDHVKSTFESYIDSLTLTPVDSLGVLENGVAVKNGQSTAVDVTVSKMSGAEVSMAGGAISSVEVSDTSVATATAEITSGGKIKINLTGGAKTGFTYVDISGVTAADEIVDDTVAIFVNPIGRVGGEHVTWDFRKANTGADVSVKTDYVPTIGYEHTAFDGENELNPGIFSEPWAAYKVANGDAYYLDNWQNLGMRIVRGTATDEFALKLNESGSFIPCVTIAGTWEGGRSTSGLNATVSLLKKGESTPICTVSNINTGAIEGPINVELSDKPIDFEKGEYILRITGNGLYVDGGNKNAYMFLQKFRLMTSVEEKLPVNQTQASDLNYNFADLNTAERMNSQEAVDRISYADTLSAQSAPWRVYNSVYGRWAGRVNTFYNGHEPALTYNAANKGLYSSTENGGYHSSAAIMFHVPADGIYTATLEGEQKTVASKANAYIYKLNPDRSIGDKICEVLDFTGDATSWQLTEGPINMDAGEYILRIWHSSTGAGMYLNSLKLKNIKTENIIAADAVAVKTRQTATGTFDVTDKEGNPITVTGTFAEATVADSSVADLKVEIKDGKISYTLTGKKNGYTTADIVAIGDDNIGAAATVEIYVNSSGRVGGESIIYDFRKVNVGDDSNLLNYLSTITYDHTTKGNSKELNPRLASEPWASHNLVSVNSWNYVYVLNAYQNGGIRGYNNTGNPSLKFKITESGTFMPRIHVVGTFNNTMGGQNVTFKLQKLNQDGGLTDVSTTERVSGDVIEGVMRAELTDAPIEFKAGEEYVLTIMGKGQWPNSRSNGYSIWMQKLELVPDYEAKLAVNEKAATSLTYDFTVMNSAENRGYQDAADSITYADTVAAGTAPWKLYTAYARNFITSKEFFKDHEEAFLYKTEGKGLTLNARAGAVIMHVPADGNYIVSFDAEAIGANASGIEAKLMPVTSRRTVENAIAEQVVTLTTAEGAKTYEFNGGLPVELKAGEYLLYLFSAGGSDLTVNKVNMQLCNIANSIDAADITAKPRSSSGGSIAVVTADGTPVELSGGSVYFTSSNSAIAEMTGEIKDGKISYNLTTYGAGDCEIEIFVLDDNNIGAQGKVKVYVNKNERVGAELPIYDFRKVNVGADPTVMGYINSITYNHTMVGGTREVNPGMYSEPWAADDAYSQDAWNYIEVINNYQNMGLRSFNLKAPRSLKFRVDEAGTYIPTLVIAGTWENLAGMNAQFEFGYNSPTGYKKLGLVSGVNASAVDGYFEVKLTDAPVEMSEGDEYLLTITNNGCIDSSKWSYMSMWMRSLELRSAREVPEENIDEVRDLVYDFAALNDAAHRGYQDAADDITYADTLAAGSEAWELYAVTPAKYVGNKVMFGEYDPAMYYDAADRGLSMVGYSGAVRIHVPTDGWYTPSFELWSSATNQIDVYFMSLADNDSPVDEIASMSFAPSKTKTVYTMNDKMPVHLSAGEYILFVRATAGNDVYLESFTLDNNNAVLSIKEQGVAAKTGETVSGSFVVYNNGEETDMTDAKIEFKVADTSIGDFKLFISGGKLCYSFDSAKRGMTTVQMSVVDKEDNGIVKTITLSVNPEGILVGDEHYYNFRKLEGTSGLYGLSEVNDIAMITAGSASEINPEIASAPWAYVASDGKFTGYSDSFNGITVAPTGAFVSFKINLATSGSYQIIPEMTAQMNGGKVDVYIAPATAADATATEYYIATADSYAPSRKSGQEMALSIKDLDAGEYIVTFKLNGKNELVSVSDIRADIVALKLKPVDFHTKMTVLPEFYPGSIARGEILEIPLIVNETDAKTEWIPAVNVSVLSLDPSVATAEIVSGEDNTGHVLRITAIKAGSTVFNVTVSKENSDSATVSIPVFVTDAQAIASRTYKYRFKNTAYTGDELRVIDSYNKVTPGSPEEYRDGSGTDRWYTFEQGKGFFQYYQDRADKYASVYLSPNIGMYATIVIELPESGIYEPQVRYEENAYGGITRMWIAPMDAEDARADEYSIGTLSTAMTDGLDKTAKFRTVELEAGEYKVTWEIIDNVAEVEGNASVPNFRLDGVDLVPLAAHPSINIETADVPTVQLGTQANVPITAVAGANESIVVYAVEDLFGASFEETSDLVDVRLEYDENDKPYAAVTGIAEGSGDVSVNLIIGGEVRGSFTVPVTVAPAVPLDRVELALKSNPTASLKIRDAGTYIADLIPTMYNTRGNIITAEGAEAMGVIYKYTSSNESVATVSDTGAVTPVSVGNVKITCEVTIGEKTKTAFLDVRVHDGKTESTYYTEEKKANARENVSKYSWARSNLATVEAALEPYLEPGMDEYIWNHLTTQELPRSYYVGSPSDPDAVSNVCRYCNANLTLITGVQHCPFLYDVLNSPWKLQCPECRRQFPSNDFGAFYELGIDEHGNWSYEKSKALGSHLLTNDSYPEKGPGWGVDDGYGYDTGVELVMTNGKTTTIKHTWISCYNHWAHMGTRNDGFGGIYDNLIEAYLWTGDERYGRLGAILTDRYADIYPDFDLAPYAYFITTGEHYPPQGKLRDYVWESGWAELGIRGYDTFYEMFDDPYVIDFLSEKAQQYDLPGEHKKIADGEKLTSGMIRENCEDGLLREAHRAMRYGEINGNFGTQHTVMALAAVVLDNFPETQEWIDWCFQSGHGSGVWHSRNVTGGNIDNVLVNEVDRDGGTRETAPNYSVMWPNALVGVAERLSGYKAYSAKNLFDNPKYLKMLAANMPLINGKRMTPPIGDSGSCASDTQGELYLTETSLPLAWQMTKDPFYAQALYFYNGDSAKGLKYDIYTKDPERLENEIAEAIREHGEYDFYSSNMLPDYGYAALRAGEVHNDLASGYRNTMQDFWIHFGHNTGHAHADMMNLGIDAFGLDIAPDLGYPISSIGDECTNWGQNSIAHNLVVVDKTRNQNEEGGEPLHFDDAGRVKVMDMDGAEAMTQPKVDKYRRTVVMVQATEEISYGIDFFHVVGGNEHVYSFHALSDELTEKPTGIELTSQVDDNGEYVGTYAGADIPYKTEGITSGYSYLYNVDKVVNPGVGEFEVDFKIRDFRNTLPIKQDMHLRMSMLNEDNVEEVVIANGEPAQKLGNPETLKYMLVRNMGGESFFTTVMEPYGSERYLSDSVQIPRSGITYAANGNQISDDEVVRAIKVIFKDDERVDYILYAQNNAVEYVIKDGDVEIPFKGFVGVYTLDKDGKNVYSYINDGTKLGDLTSQAAYTGSVESFTDDLELENFINVSLGGNVKAEEIVGRYAYIDGEGYDIVDAKNESDGSITIALGNVSLVKTRDDDGNYTFHMKKGDSVRIPLSAYEDTAPVITNAADEFTVAAGSAFNLTATAYSPSDNNVELSAVELPRGASFDSNTNTVKWTPDSNQIGKHIIAVKADDGALQSIKYFTVDVVRSAGAATPTTPTDKPDNTPSGSQTPSGEGSGSGSGSGSGGGASGGGSGGGSSSGGSSDTSDNTGTEDNNTDVGTGVPDGSTVTTEKFVDLGSHTWAKDAIYALVDAGVVNGTSENTYSPEANIKRADFAIMLVRAFGVTEGEGEQFADVDTNKYYAKELLLAKANGIVGGIGDNKFNPEGEITRQDMMLMLTRALEAQGKKLNAADQSVLAQFADAAQISDYAKEAVARVAQAGIIAGSNGRIKPLAKATRAEIAVMLNRVLAK